MEDNTDKNLEILAELTNRLDIKSSFDDVVKAFELIVKVAEQIKEGNDEERTQIEQKIETALSKMQNQLSSELSNEVTTMKERFRVLSAKVRDGYDGKDGAPGAKGDKGDSIIGPQGPVGPAGSPDTPDEVVEKVNKSTLLIAKERVEGLIDAIRMATANAVASMPVTTSFFNGLRAKNLTIVGATAKQVGDTVFVTPTGGSGGGVDSVVAGTGITVDATDPANPIVAATASAPAWGDITGTLSNQTDLQSALDGKQPLDSDLTTIAGLTATSDNFMQAKAGAWASRTVAQVKTDLSLSGTNTGDQTSIAGITGTKAQFDTAVTDGNFLYVGDVTQYTDEMAQDAVGGILTDTATIDFTYDDAGASITASVKAASITEAMQVLADNTTQDFSTTKHGYVPKGTNVGNFLKDDGTWAAPSGGGNVSKVGTPVDNQIGIWTGDGTIEGVTSLTYDGTSFNLATGKNFQIAGATVLADAAGTTTLSNIDALDATTEATVEAAIDTLANLTSVQGFTVTLSDAGADALLGWDDSANAYELMTQAEVLAVVGDSTATAKGVVELATDAETVTGTDTVRATTPANLVAKMAAPGAIGGTTAAAITGTTIQANTGFVPDANDGAFLGTSALGFSDLFLAEGGVINWDNGDATLTQVGDVVTLAGADLKVTTPGNAATSVLTTDGTQTLTNKTLTSPTLTTPSAFTTGGTITLAENTSIALDPAGSADGKWSGITVAGTAGYTAGSAAFGDLVYLAVADSRWEKADADALATAGNVLLGMMLTDAPTDGSACNILLYGIIRADAKFPALTVGAGAYVGETAGAIQVAIPTGADNIIRVVGFALTADEIMFNPSPDWQVTVA